MKRLLLPLTVALTLLAGGCKTPSPSSTPGDQPPAATGTGATSPSANGSGGSGTGGGTSESGPAFTVRYNWGVPSAEVTVEHKVVPPLQPPPGIPLPYLVEVRTGDHTQDGFARITFAFRGAYPGYRFQYVRQLTADGSGNPVALAGNSVLRIVFVTAQAHDENGKSTIAYASNRQVGIGKLTAYAPAGDFEGYVTYGLGITVAAGSDQVAQIRVGELQRTDGTYVVAFDVR
jgi:hypothetical protein